MNKTTTEDLDKAQFGRTLHKRPCSYPNCECGDGFHICPEATGPDLDRQPERVKPIPSNYRRMEKPK